MQFHVILARIAVCGTLAGLIASCSGAAAQQPAPADEPFAPPTVVLVHGAFADSSSWNAVITDLEREGFPVIAAANPLRGLRSDAQYLRTVLDSVDGPVVLAGHSYGGSVMGEAAVGHPNVKALVYIASFILEPGEATSALAAKFPGGQLGPALDTVPFPGGGSGNDLYIKRDEFRRVFAADVAPEIAALMAATQRPITDDALNEAATAAAWKTIPSWNMVTTEDLAIPPDSMRFMGARANSQTVEIDASHAVTVSQPGAVADLISDAAHVTAT
ncbi:alpha/beta fold hydrolase [Mycolicibacterium iranicum]|uniref:Alpha/beta hydrolase n=1 Tax=Mycolicibacterium iranicum TaxID=912594 RepID=A0A1X1W739_MYCIR|nr:alpha/beta hydrolase [Mycolicibacterium iranicum]MCZ0727732.1 alpha/beta hydrolase [Mycolicibacterium iranicum]ORV82338.1 alpha/beta hydrolase [Mycolicibacterium iranicum]